MAKLKLKVAKSGRVNPQTKAKGFAARVITNGTAGYEDIVAEGCHNTTLHKAEAKVALELCMESVAEMLKQGYIVDLGPVVNSISPVLADGSKRQRICNSQALLRRSTIVQPTRWQQPSRTPHCNGRRKVMKMRREKRLAAVARLQAAAATLAAVRILVAMMCCSRKRCFAQSQLNKTGYPNVSRWCEGFG